MDNGNTTEPSTAQPTNPSGTTEPNIPGSNSGQEQSPESVPAGTGQPDSTVSPSSGSADASQLPPSPSTGTPGTEPTPSPVATTVQDTTGGSGPSNSPTSNGTDAPGQSSTGLQPTEQNVQSVSSISVGPGTTTPPATPTTGQRFFRKGATNISPKTGIAHRLRPAHYVGGGIIILAIAGAVAFVTPPKVTAPAPKVASNSAVMVASPSAALTPTTAPVICIPVTSTPTAHPTITVVPTK